MPRPNFIKEEDIKRWSDSIDNDPNIPKDISNFTVIKEVCIAGLWMSEELQKLNCPESLIVRIQYTAGKISFGKDPWDVHQQILNNFINNKLDFEEAPDEKLN